MNEIIATIRGWIEKLRFFIIINAFENGIRTRGPLMVLLRPGFHWAWPCIDTLYRQSVRWRASASGIMTFKTADGHSLTLNIAWGYEIADLMKMYNRIHHPEDFWILYAPMFITSYGCRHTLAECSPDLLMERVAVDVQAFSDAEGFGFARTSLAIKSWFDGIHLRVIGDAVWGNSGPVLETSKAVGAK